jgi:hypothetical protein
MLACGASGGVYEDLEESGMNAAQIAAARVENSRPKPFQEPF